MITSSALEDFFDTEIAGQIAGEDFVVTITDSTSWPKDWRDFFKNVVWKWDLGEMTYKAWDRSDGCANVVYLLGSLPLKRVQISLKTPQTEQPTYLGDVVFP